ncbi:MAG: serine protease [Chitinophagia bacterium]
MGKRSKRKAAKRKLEKQNNKKARLKYFEKAPSFKDNFNNDVSTHQLIFPIIRKISEQQFVTVGTGFFIHPAGGFVTAKHCLYLRDAYDDKCYAIHSIQGGHRFIRKIQYFEAHPIADIGVGMLRGNINDSKTHETILCPSFPIADKTVQIEDSIFTLAYPRMRINRNQVGTFPVDKFSGKIKEYFPNGTAWLKDKCFLTNMHILSMASGGPVLRENKIIGVNSTAMELHHDEEPISFITPISKIYDLTLKDSDGKEVKVQDLMNEGHMPKAK